MSFGDIFGGNNSVVDESVENDFSPMPEHNNTFIIHEAVMKDTQSGGTQVVFKVECVGDEFPQYKGRLIWERANVKVIPNVQKWGGEAEEKARKASIMGQNFCVGVGALCGLGGAPTDAQGGEMAYAQKIFSGKVTFKKGSGDFKDSNGIKIDMKQVDAILKGNVATTQPPQMQQQAPQMQQQAPNFQQPQGGGNPFSQQAPANNGNPFGQQ